MSVKNDTRKLPKGIRLHFFPWAPSLIRYTLYRKWHGTTGIKGYFGTPLAATKRMFLDRKAFDYWN